MKIRLAIVLPVFFLSPGLAASQERWQADVAIRAMTVTEADGQLTCNVEVYNEYDDDARDITLRILLPVGVRFVSSATGCTAGPSAAADGTQGVATCEIGTLAVGGSRTAQVVTTLPPTEISKRFGAFAWSVLPDPRPASNYSEAIAP